MLHILSVTSVLFVTILLGFICGQFKKFQPRSDLVLIHFVFYVALPATLFYACYQSHLHIQDLQYGMAYVVAMLAVIGITFLFSHVVLREKSIFSVMNTMSVSQVDGAYFTIPLFLLIFHSPVMAISLMAIQNIIFFTFSVFAIELLRTERSVTGTELGGFVFSRAIKVLFTNPIILSSVLGFAAAAIHMPLNMHIEKILVFIGKATAPVALFSLGISCAYGLKGGVRVGRWPSVISLSLIKLLLFPVIALLVGYLLRLPAEYLAALVLLCASPTATHNYIIATEYDLEPMVQTYIVVITTIFSFFSVNLWIYIVHS